MTQRNLHTIWTKDGEQIKHWYEPHRTWYINRGQVTDRLRALRAKLKENLPTAPLFDCERNTRHIESAFESMWDRYLKGLEPESFHV